MKKEQYNFDTASIIDEYPNAPSCSVQFKTYGKKKKIFGKIRTVKCFQDNGLIKKLFNNKANGEVLIIDGSASLQTALMGDMIAKAGIDNGWVGAIIYGLIRDSVTINQMDIGIKALGTNPKKSSKLNIGSIDIPVSFGNINFIPGEYVYSDEDGIVTLQDLII